MMVRNATFSWCHIPSVKNIETYLWMYKCMLSMFTWAFKLIDTEINYLELSMILTTAYITFTYFTLNILIISSNKFLFCTREFHVPVPVFIILPPCFIYYFLPFLRFHCVRFPSLDFVSSKKASRRLLRTQVFSVWLFFIIRYTTSWTNSKHKTKKKQNNLTITMNIHHSTKQ